jgi:hypothetical protein
MFDGVLVGTGSWMDYCETRRLDSMSRVDREKRSHDPAFRDRALACSEESRKSSHNVTR